MVKTECTIPDFSTSPCMFVLDLSFISPLLPGAHLKGGVGMGQIRGSEGRKSPSGLQGRSPVRHRCRHGFEVGGTNSGVAAWSAGIFLACPQFALCPPNFGGTAGHTTVEKIDIVKITRVKKQGTVDLATSWYSWCFAEYTTRNLKQKVYILWTYDA